MGFHRWNGSSWVANQTGNVVKRWNGSSWANIGGNLHQWDGSKWVSIGEQSYVKEWTATWHKSYIGNNTQLPPNRYKQQMIHQGRYGNPDTGYYGDLGIQKGIIGFNATDMRNNLAGAKIQKVELFLRSAHFWYYSGGIASIGYHNFDSAPWTFSSSRNSVKEVKYTTRDQGQWITLPNEFGELVRDNKVRGLTLFRNTTSPNYYGYFYGVGTSNPPKIRISYVK